MSGIFGCGFIRKRAIALASKPGILAIVANGGGQGTCYVSAPGVTPVSPTPYYASACSSLASDNNNVNADATAANVGIVIGSIGAVATVISLIVAASSYGDSKSATASHVTLTPFAGRGLGGMSVGGSF